MTTWNQFVDVAIPLGGSLLLVAAIYVVVATAWRAK